MNAKIGHHADGSLLQAALSRGEFVCSVAVVYPWYCVGIVLSTHPHRIALWIDVSFLGILRWVQHGPHGGLHGGGGSVTKKSHVELALLNFCRACRHL